MKPALINLLLTGLCALLGACGSQKTVNCIEATLPVQYMGFSAAQLDTILLYRYPAGSSFSSPADSVYSSTAGTRFTSSGDTLISDEPSFETSLRCGYDYRISIPGAGYEARVSHITLEGQETMTYREPFLSKVDISICINAVKSYQLDGRHVQVTTPEYEAHFVTIVR